MKTSYLRNSILMILVSSTSFAQTSPDLKWVKTSFWTAPQLTQMDVRLEQPSKEFQNQCSLFKQRVKNANVLYQGDVATLKKKVEELRSKEWLDDQGESVRGARLKMNASLTYAQNLEQDVDLEGGVSADENKNQLPFFTQLKATTGAVIDKAQFSSTNLSSDAYSKLTLDLGLKESNVSLDGTSIVIDGLDLACDLINGSASLQARAPSYLVLNQDSFKDLERFYKKLTLEISKVLASKTETSLVVKAARIGYRLGKLLEENPGVRDEEIAIQQIIKLVDVLFVPKKLDPTPVFNELEKKKSVDNTVETGFVTLNFKLD